MNTIANRFVLTANLATVMLGSRPYSIVKTDAVYEEVVALIKAKASEAEVQEVIEATAAKLKKSTQLTTNIAISNSAVTYTGHSVDNSLTERMRQMLDEGFDIVPRAKFLENLMQNPSSTAIRELYSFIEKGNMPVTPDGYFMVYKAVPADYHNIKGRCCRYKVVGEPEGYYTSNKPYFNSSVYGARTALSDEQKDNNDEYEYDEDEEYSVYIDGEFDGVYSTLEAAIDYVDDLDSDHDLVEIRDQSGSFMLSYI